MAYLQSHYRIGKINRTIVFIHASTQFQPIERNQNEELINFRANQIWYHNNWLSCRYFWTHDVTWTKKKCAGIFDDCVAYDTTTTVQHVKHLRFSNRWNQTNLIVSVVCIVCLLKIRVLSIVHSPAQVETDQPGKLFTRRHCALRITKKRKLFLTTFIERRKVRQKWM